jgi:hypothetical protein
LLLLKMFHFPCKFIKYLVVLGGLIIIVSVRPLTETKLQKYIFASSLISD